MVTVTNLDIKEVITDLIQEFSSNTADTHTRAYLDKFRYWITQRFKNTNAKEQSTSQLKPLQDKARDVDTQLKALNERLGKAEERISNHYKVIGHLHMKLKSLGLEKAQNSVSQAKLFPDFDQSRHVDQSPPKSKKKVSSQKQSNRRKRS